MTSRPARVAWWVVYSLLRAMWISAMVLIPLFGFWLATSLAAYSNASQWLAACTGLLLFLVPVGWDLWFAWRRRKRPALRAILTRLDRLVLRTLIVNALFLGGMMYFAHHTAFRALAVRGDWFLDGHDGAAANTVRGWILAFADHFDRRPSDDHYGKSDDAPDDVTPPTPKPPPPPPPSPTAGDIEAPKAASGWPLSAEVEPAVSGMPESAQASIETVGAYLADHFPDPKLRVKAIHDYVALRLSYDTDAFKAIMARDWEHVASQEAPEVFAGKKGVCEGYARLMVALGKAAGVEIAYVTGYIRDARRRVEAGGDDATVKAALEGYGHAWNAVKLDGEWQLIDATWDDPIGSTAPVTSTYLFTPPRLFAYDHLPEEAAWQLLPEPLSPGDFARQPMLSPTIGTLGVTVVEPTRSQVTVDGEVTLVVDNPYGARLAATARLDGHDDHGRECAVGRTEGTRVTITCKLESGEYEVELFGATRKDAEATHRLAYLGSILANSR